MDEIMNYIFSSLRNSENTVRKIQGKLRKYSRFNRNIAIFAVLISGYIVWSEAKQRRQAEEIKKLKKEVEGIRHDKRE